MKSYRKTPLIFLLICSFTQAVNLSSNGTGQAVIVPYYTVNNGLNTLGTITNTTEMVKAIKIHFLEGRNAKNVLSFNIYLAPYDVWTFALAETTSTVANHTGEPSAQLISNDASCAPLLNTSGQEFWPYEIDLEAPNNSMQRAREGVIQIIEMGELDPQSEFGLAASFNGDDTPNDCELLKENWENGGQWVIASDGDPTTQMLPAAGGLKATVSLIDVAQGAQYNIQTTAIDNFYPTNTIVHTQPGGDVFSPTLADADTTSLVIDNGQAITSNWDHGYEAVSALFMKSSLMNEFSLEQAVAARTEWVVTLPTKQHYTNGNEALAPFTKTYNSTEGACEVIPTIINNRESLGIELPDLFDSYYGCIATPLPGDCETPNVSMCSASNTITFTGNGEDTRGLLESSNTHDIGYIPVSDFQNGHLKFGLSTFNGAANNAIYTGLPVMGFSMQRATNAGAQPGLLAQYGSTQNHSYETDIIPLF